jgi:BlaI family transcriptional regulator, penicillinase repressor
VGRKRNNRQFTPLELEIMKVLWEIGPATVQGVQQKLPGELAYTTVQTMLNVLHRKGKVRRALKGRAYEYEPSVSREKAVRVALRDVINRLFGGSAESLVMSLVASRHLTVEKLAELHRLVSRSQEDEKAQEARHGSS